MGFSWPSCVAQDTLLSNSDLDTDRVLSVDAPLPNNLSLVFAVATDDLMVFSDVGPGATTAVVLNVEVCMEHHGIVNVGEKDIDEACRLHVLGST